MLVLFLWTFNDFNTPYVLFGTAQPPQAADLISFHIYALVRDLELRPRLGDVGAAAAVPAGGDRAYLLVTGRRSPSCVSTRAFRVFRGLVT